MEQERTPRTGSKPTDSYLKYSSFAFQLFGGIGLAAWAGYSLDHYLALKFPAFLLTFVFVVFGGMMYQMYKLISKK